MRIMMVALLLLSMGCQADQHPQGIEPHDACTSCKMAISELRYAAQLVDKDGNAFKFDDIGCMLRFLRDHNLPKAKVYVMDFVHQQWLEGESATFVRSEAIKSPMASGLAAFHDQSAAQQFLKNNSGEMMTFSELMNGEKTATHASRRPRRPQEEP